MKRVLLAWLLCALSVAAFGATPSNASLKGIYGVNYASANNNAWYAVVSCPNFSGQVYAGSETSTDVVDGTMTFDGKGIVTYAVTEYGKFDQALSNATVTWTCSPQGNPVITDPGNAVYDAPTAATGTGTYAIQSNYTGALVISGDPGLILRVSNLNTKGLASRFMFHGIYSNNRGDGAGEGALQ
jgi:hypothetical protein